MMKRSQLRLVLPAVLLLMVALFLLCAGCRGESSLTRVRLNEVTRSVFYAPMYVAINQGFFEEEGLELEITTGEGADKVMTAVLAGQADIGFMGPEASIYVYNQGQENYAVNFAQLTKRDGSFLVAREPDPEFSWDKLQGKSVIGGRKGGVPLMTLEYVLRQNGLVPGQDVEVMTHIQFALMAGAFTGGTGDYVTLFEPVAAALELEGKGFVVASVGEESGEIPYTAFSARKALIDSDPELIQRFTNAIYRGQLWVHSHTPEEIAAAIKPSFPDMDLEILTTVAARYMEIDAWASTPVFTEEAFNKLQEVMELAGELDRRAPYASLVDNTFAEKAVAEIK